MLYNITAQSSLKQQPFTSIGDHGLVFILQE